jgi:adenylate cyclase
MSQTQDDLNVWLVQQGLEGAPQEELLEGYCQRLVGLDLPLMRLHVSQSAFHPKYGGLGFEWQRDAGITREHYEFTETPLVDWVQSPFYHMLRTGQMVYRERLGDDPGPSRFPLLDSLRTAGATDYYASGLAMARGVPDQPMNPDAPPEGLLISWVSDRPGGFSDADCDRLRGGLPYLGMILKSAANRQMARDLLQVYLGRDAGQRVMSGELGRGSLQQIDAVICNFDLTGFTSMAERLPGPDLIDMLNDYFALAVDEIQGAGGHVLKFMGDGLMAMFDCGNRTADANAALDAVAALRARMAARNREREAAGLPTTRATAALHAGEILYGNIGAETRLDFTVIGPAVNLTARLSGMHRAVGQEVILSEEVQRAATPGRHDLVSLGRYMMRGVGAPRELFTIFQA